MFFSEKYLCKLDQNKMFELSQVRCVGLVLDGPLVVDLGQELGLLDVRVEVKRVVPILKKKKLSLLSVRIGNIFTGISHRKTEHCCCLNTIKMYRLNKLVKRHSFLHKLLRYYNKSFI